MKHAMRIAFLLFLVPSVVCGQAAPRLLDRYGESDTDFLYRIRTAMARGDRIAVLTDPEPTVHLFAADAHRAWGGRGRGPAELEAPVDMVWLEQAVVVLDQNLQKLVSFALGW